VAVLAALSNACEHRLHVTLRAGNGLMHPAQRILCLVVIEFRNSPDWFPPGRCVTVLTGDVQISVWTVRAAGSLRPGAPHYSSKHEETNRECFAYAPSPHWTCPLPSFPATLSKTV
jgi:hypothetical protein